MVYILSIINIIICTYILIKTIDNLSKNNNQSIFFVYIVFYFFFIVPIILNYIYGLPSYDKYPNLKIANSDNKTTVVYYIYMIFISVFWHIFGRKKTKVNLDYNI